MEGGGTIQVGGSKSAKVGGGIKIGSPLREGGGGTTLNGQLPLNLEKVICQRSLILADTSKF